MKILVLTPSPPNEYNRIRLLNNLKVMSRFAQITLVSLVTNPYEADDLKKNSNLCERVIGVNAPKAWSYFSCLLALLKNKSLRSAYCDFPEFHRLMDQLSKKDFDLIYIKRLRMVQYAYHFDASKVIVDATDSMGLYYDRLCKLRLSYLQFIISKYEKSRLRKYESHVARLYRLIVCSSVDSAYIERAAGLPLGTVKMLPNVVDLEKFQYRSTLESSKQLRIGFLGVFSAATNEDAAWWLATEIYPNLQTEFLSIECEIVGLFPSKRLLKLKNSGLTIMGYVSDVSHVMHRWDAFVCPLRSGAGVKNKILQCFALGVPVIATPLSIEGLVDLQVGKHLLLANNVQEFVQQLLSLKAEPQLALNLSQCGRQYVENHYSLDSLGKSMKECFKNFMQT
jgi:glycosyltransferase involved in cell wall biosynthesis